MACTTLFVIVFTKTEPDRTNWVQTKANNSIKSRTSTNKTSISSSWHKRDVLDGVGDTYIRIYTYHSLPLSLCLSISVCIQRVGVLHLKC